MGSLRHISKVSTGLRRHTSSTTLLAEQLLALRERNAFVYEYVDETTDQAFNASNDRLLI